MAVFVLLTFDDEGEAHDFVGLVLNTRTRELDVALYSMFRAMSVWGVFKKPTQFCECVGGRKTASGFTRGLKYGWWVCAKCKKPTARWASGRQWFSVIGSNLLPKKLRPYPDEMSSTLESPAAWNDLLVDEENPLQTP